MYSSTCLWLQRDILILFFFLQSDLRTHATSISSIIQRRSTPWRMTAPRLLGGFHVAATPPTMYPCSLFSITFVLLLLVSRPPMTKTRHVLPTSHPYLQRHSTGHIFTFSSCRRRLYAPFVISARLRVYSRFFSAPIGSTRIYRPDAAPEGIMSDPALLGLPTWDL